MSVWNIRTNWETSKRRATVENSNCITCDNTFIFIARRTLTVKWNSLLSFTLRYCVQTARRIVDIHSARVRACSKIPHWKAKVVQKIFTRSREQYVRLPCSLPCSYSNDNTNSYRLLQLSFLFRWSSNQKFHYLISSLVNCPDFTAFSLF